ncbi:alpha/beta hydrolase [Pseudovibrio denitrificans]|uniref:alpha/beta hydrolase n=1 Tax=Pseudovibrio denitrificans TaxID=258256 RepID=UPI001AD8C3F8|nr:alpha/beta hydrolase [Pseudovibrio denitrificans]
MDAITAPVLILGGAKDRVVAPRIARVTANRYKKNGKLVVLPDSDHVMMVGKELKNTMREFDQWVAENNIVPQTEELEEN